MVLGLILLTAYVVLYALIVREFRLLKGEVMKTAFFRVNIFKIIFLDEPFFYSHADNNDEPYSILFSDAF